MLITNFKQLIGNSSQIMLLERSLQNNTLPKFTLLAGQYGTGKSSSALVAAMAVNCENRQDGNPCCRCNSCTAILKSLDSDKITSNFVSVNMARRNKSKEFGDLLKEIFSLQTVGTCVYVLEEIQALKDTELQTALLDEIDRMGKNVYIIGTTTDSYKLIAPLRSRARIFNFSRINKGETNLLIDKLCQIKNIRISKEIRALIVDTSEGIPRDTESLIDFVAENHITYEELQNYLKKIKLDDILNLFVFLRSDKISDYLNILDQLLSSSSEAEVVRALKNFVVKVMYYSEGSIKEGFTRDQQLMLDVLLQDINVFTLAADLQKLNEKSSKTDIEFALLCVHQKMQKKSVAQIFSENKTLASSQVKTAETRRNEIEYLERKQSVNNVQKLDMNSFLGGISSLQNNLSSQQSSTSTQPMSNFSVPANLQKDSDKQPVTHTNEQNAVSELDAFKD